MPLANPARALDLEHRPWIERSMEVSVSTTIIGIDYSTENKKVGLALGLIDGDRIVVRTAALGSEVKPVAETIYSWIEPPTLLAMDAPLGWPAPLSRALIEHRAGEPIATARNAMFRRETDREVCSRLGLTPLDVGADRIARTAHSALHLLGELRELAGRPIPLVWGDAHDLGVIEVYPAATLKTYGLTHKSYKKNNAEHRDARRGIADALAKRMTLEVDAELLHANDDRLDAVVCVLAGADYLRGHALPPTRQQRPLGEREGWIWVRSAPPSPTPPG